MALSGLLVQVADANVNIGIAAALPISHQSAPGATSFVAPPGYPTTAFSSYYPAPSGQEPQPALYDPILNITYPANLTNPDTIPTNKSDPLYFPQPIANLTAAQQQQVIDKAIQKIQAIVVNPKYPTNCSKCIAALPYGRKAAQMAPLLLPSTIIKLCTQSGLHSAASCEASFSANTFGDIWTQVLAFADVAGPDGQYICNSISDTYCSAPSTAPLNMTGLFPKPKPANATAPAASGKRVKVLHLSDLHLDPRYKVGAEGNCSINMCCRSNQVNDHLPSGTISHPAPLYGYYHCDVPYDLALAAMQAIGPLTGTSKQNPLAWSLYTGDLVAHDAQNQLSRLYMEYAENSVYGMLKSYVTGPVFPVLGNHDTVPESIDGPHSLPGPLGQQFSWNYDHVAGLWQHEGWLSKDDAKQARLHYGGYSIKNHYGLRVITFNSDFWYKANFFNFINTTDPDVSGSFKFVIDELQAAEDAGERVWIIAHVLSGWDGSNPLPNPTNLFYQIIDRYSPHVIANVFFGHTHEDQVMIYYANNGTVQNRNTAINTGWIGPSITPLTNLNSGFRMYEVDTGSFDVYEAYTFIADVSSFSDLNATGPVFKYEYSTRDVYGPAAGWPSNAPLNGTFWHAVTEAMEADHSLVTQFNTYQGKSSIMSPNCTNSACTEAKICYIRSGSVPLGRQCPQGYGSVQSPFKPQS